jgi:hypothetical protein
MVILEVVVALLGTTLFVAAMAALWLGFLGVIGAVRFGHCAECGRLGLTSSAEPLEACVRCRHNHFLHPVLTVHHAHVFRHQAKHHVA